MPDLNASLVLSFAHYVGLEKTRVGSGPSRADRSSFSDGAMPIIQLIINIFITLAIVLVLSISFQITYSATKSFILSSPAITTLSAYFFFSLQQLIPSLAVNLLVSLLLASTIAVLLELCVYSHQRSKGNSLISILVSSLGIYVILQNLISLVWGDDTKRIRTGDVEVGHQILTAYITNIDIITIMSGVILFVVVVLVMDKTTIGKQIRAVSDNPELCNIYGLNSNRIILWATAIGGALAAVAGILIALEANMTPTLGFDYFLYGVVAMIIGGVGSYRGLAFGSLLLASAQHFAAYYFDTRWMDATVYFILIAFLICKPLGFSGKRLRKVEV